eukprot:4449400-Amphidinium_carterae.1
MAIVLCRWATIRITVILAESKAQTDMTKSQWLRGEVRMRLFHRAQVNWQMRPGWGCQPVTHVAIVVDMHVFVQGMVGNMLSCMANQDRMMFGTQCGTDWDLEPPIIAYTQ